MPTRYVSPDEDSGRWDGFPFRQGDIVISTRSKSGTTWMQMICALLICQTPDLPVPLASFSPWLDMTTSPAAQVIARLEAQQHRRVIKTHTPLDGIPLDDRATYIVVGRHPLDMAVSLYHQGNNINRQRLRELSGTATSRQPAPPRLPVREWLRRWIGDDAAPQEQLDSLRGVMWHLSDAWQRRHQRNIVLVHYDDLTGDLPGQMRALADRLDAPVPEHRWPELVHAASFEAMRSRAPLTVPGPRGVLIDPAAFYRRGTSGAGVDVLDAADVARYHERARELAPADLLRWLHRSPA